MTKLTIISGDPEAPDLPPPIRAAVALLVARVVLAVAEVGVPAGLAFVFLGWPSSLAIGVIMLALVWLSRRVEREIRRQQLAARLSRKLAEILAEIDTAIAELE